MKWIKEAVGEHGNEEERALKADLLQEHERAGLNVFLVITHKSNFGNFPYFFIICNYY